MTLFSGVVVNIVANESIDDVCWVLVLYGPEGDFGVNKLFIVHKNAQLLDDASGRLCTEGARKRMRRILGKPLFFGDMISWEKEDSKGIHIFKFERVSKIFDVRLKDRDEICIEGVRCPLENIFWNEYFPVQTDDEAIKKAEPNIWVRGWFSINFSSDKAETAHPIFKLVEFENEFSLENQSKVLSAPWNSSSDVFQPLIPVATESMYDTDDEAACPIIKPIIADEPLGNWREAYHEVIGILVDEHIVYVHEISKFEFVVPVVYPDIPVGSFVKISAQWSNAHKFYLVRRIRKAPELVDDIRTTNDIPPQIVLRVVPSNILPGIFEDAADQLPSIHDPQGLLAMSTVLSRPKRGVKVTVAACRLQHNETVRLRITSVASKSSKTLDAFNIKNQKIVLTDLYGVVIGSNGDVFCAKHPAIKFRLQSVFYRTIPGQQIYFDAVHEPSLSEHFHIQKYKRVQGEVEVTQRRIWPGSVRKQTLFKVTARAPIDFSWYLVSEQLGHIDCMDKCDQKPVADNQSFSIWVTQGRLVDGVRQSKFPFQLVSMGEVAPDDVGGECVDVSANETRSTNKFDLTQVFLQNMTLSSETSGVNKVRDKDVLYDSNSNYAHRDANLNETTSTQRFNFSQILKDNISIVSESSVKRSSNLLPRSLISKTDSTLLLSGSNDTMNTSQFTIRGEPSTPFVRQSRLAEEKAFSLIKQYGDKQDEVIYRNAQDQHEYRCIREAADRKCKRTCIFVSLIKSIQKQRPEFGIRCYDEDIKKDIIRCVNESI